MINWSELQEFQKDLDVTIMEPRGLNYKTTKQMRIIAALVEIGEVANEIRAFKFWSNKLRSEDDVLLDELADVLHFILSLLNAEGINYNEMRVDTFCAANLNEQILGLYESLIIWDRSNWFRAMQYYLGLVQMLGFTESDLYEAYMKKNAENYRRQEEGY